MELYIELMIYEYRFWTIFISVVKPLTFRVFGIIGS